MIRLNKMIANAGVCSRRKADELIRQGRVQVNHKIVTELGVQIEPRNDRIEIDGQPVELPEKEILILFNKPQNCLTTVSDNFRRKIVFDFINVPYRIYPVGRLDFDAEGLLILTNSGELAYRLAHPKFKIDKVYHVTVEKPVTPEMVHRLQAGVAIESGVTVTAGVRVVSPHVVELTLHQGIKRQVKRMIKAVGNRVTALKRTRLGTLELGDLQPGEWRYLKEEEIAQLKKIVRLPWK
ncbi:ribosomal large subunit pseudouridine synthase B [bacterium BMS3Abin05]|nr:ribosomal large subunit pseudouridine synthase B [bacterium BMS3Abin05]GBE26194.1 ribosomal large subunit pseudouridine synthase B [bacterium BMS3Bbin03]HDZ12221.1 rRNA pseudouridine synthase [Bacteroidota bacterium]